MSKPKRVHIIDDDKGIAEGLMTLLNAEGYDATASHGGFEALEYLHKQKQRPDVILLDIRMPGLDGPGFRKAQLKSPRLAKIPVIFMTASLERPEASHEVRSDCVLPKPIDFDQLLATINRCGNVQAAG